MSELRHLYRHDAGDGYRLLQHNGMFLGEVSVGGGSPVYPTENLLHRYIFDDYTDDEGSMTLQAVGSGNSFVSGKVGDCLSLNGSGSAESVAAMSDSFNEFSFSFWCKGNTDPSNTPIFVRRSNDWIIWIQGAGNPYIQFYNGTSGPWKNIIGTVDINDNDWHHIVCTYADNGDAIIYVDNDVDNSGNIGASLSNTTSADFVVGAYGGSQMYTGLIDQLYMYDKVLDTDEIALLWNNGDGV